MRIGQPLPPRSLSILTFYLHSTTSDKLVNAVRLYAVWAAEL